MTGGGRPSIELRVLGPLEVSAGGQWLALGSPKQRALLAALVISANRVVGVDQLVEELWGDEAPARAMASLQAYISRLRRLLQPTGPNRSRSDVLVTQPPGYLLRVDPAAIDAVRFEGAAREGMRLLGEGDPPAALASLEAAHALWRGAPYADFTFEQFAQAEIARLEELHLAAVEARLVAMTRTGQPAAAVAEAEAVVRDHPLREGVWAALMTGLYLAGRQADALRAYQRARVAFAEEMGIEPGPALQELEGRILRQSPDLGSPSPAPPVVTPPAPAPALEETIVGRTEELARFDAALAGAQAGQGRAVVVHGEPGIGKSHLAREMGRRAAEAGAIVGDGSCAEGAATPAYWPWTQALRRMLEPFEPDAVPEGVRRALVELAQLDPALAEWAAEATGPPLPAEPDLVRARLQHAAVDAVTGLSAVRTAVVVLDDAHWADQSSLQVLALVGPELARVPVVVVVTHRDEDTAPASLRALARLPGALDIPLGGLDVAAVHRFVEATAGQPIGEEVAEAIATRTSGNPLFVVELTRLLRSERSLDEHGVRHAPVPAGVRDVVRRRLDRLPPQTTTVLTVAAVIGRRFELGVLERVAQVSEDELLDQVESSVAIGLVTEDAGSVGAFAFAHDLVRDALQEAVSGTRRARLHARIARALIEQGDRPFDAAHHLLQAMPIVAAEEVAPHVAAAADAAVAGLAFEQAEQQLRQALGLVQALPPDLRAAHELAVRVRLGRVLTFIHGHAWPEVGEHIGRAVELAEEVEPREEVIQALWAVAVFTGVAGQLARTLAVGRKLLAWGEQHGNAAAVCLGHTALGGFAWCVGDLGTAISHSDLAVAVADADDLDPTLVYDPELAAGVSARANQAIATWLAGGEEESQALMADAVRRAEVSGKDSALVFAWSFDAWLGVLRRDLAHARRRAGEATALADTIGYRQFALIGRMFAAAAIDDAAARASELDQLVAGWESTGARLYQTCFLTLQADAELAGDGVERAEELLVRALDIVEATGERFYEPEIHRLLGTVAERQGRFEAAGCHDARAAAAAGELGLVAFERRLAAR